MFDNSNCNRFDNTGLKKQTDMDTREASVVESILTWSRQRVYLCTIVCVVVALALLTISVILNWNLLYLVFVDACKMIAI